MRKLCAVICSAAHFYFVGSGEKQTPEGRARHIAYRNGLAACLVDSIMKLTAIASLFLPSIHALAISAPQTITLDSQGPSSVRPLTRRTNDNSKWPQGISEHFFDQKLDHDDIASKKTFKQRYLVSDRHYVPGGPVILYLPGDDSAEAVSDIFDYGIVDTIAKETNGLAILLEHRYYGASIPTPDLTTVNLQWLTVAQALEDFANFAQKVDLGYDNRAARINVPWISYGSGYGGALVAFLQSNYKNVTFAGIASSASVQFKVDFWEYWENIRINGGQCTNYVVEVVDYIDNLHSAGEKDKIKALKKQFGLQDLIDYRDFMWVLSHVLEEWRERKWYDSKAARVWPNFCKTLASAIRSDDSREDRMTKLLANYSDYIFKHYVVPALRTGIQNVIAKWHTPAKVPPQNLTSSQFDLTQTWRPYLYQKCTEFVRLSRAS